MLSPFVPQGQVIAEVDLKKFPKGQVEVKMDQAQGKIFVILTTITNENVVPFPG